MESNGSIDSLDDWEEVSRPPSSDEGLDDNLDSPGDEPQAPAGDRAGKADGAAPAAKKSNAKVSNASAVDEDALESEGAESDASEGTRAETKVNAWLQVAEISLTSGNKALDATAVAKSLDASPKTADVAGSAKKSAAAGEPAAVVADSGDSSAVSETELPPHQEHLRGLTLAFCVTSLATLCLTATVVSGAVIGLQLARGGRDAVPVVEPPAHTRTRTDCTAGLGPLSQSTSAEAATNFSEVDREALLAAATDTRKVLMSAYDRCMGSLAVAQEDAALKTALLELSRSKEDPSCGRAHDADDAPSTSYGGRRAAAAEPRTEDFNLKACKKSCKGSRKSQCRAACAKKSEDLRRERNTEMGRLRAQVDRLMGENEALRIRERAAAEEHKSHETKLRQRAADLSREKLDWKRAAEHWREAYQASGDEAFARAGAAGALFPGYHQWRGLERLKQFAVHQLKAVGGCTAGEPIATAA